MDFTQTIVPPADSVTAGYGRLVNDLAIEAPLRHLTVISDRSIRGSSKTDGNVTTYERREGEGMTPDPIWHLDFALRKEPLDLLLTKKAFQAIGPKPVADYIEAGNTLSSRRRMWFLYEWLTNEKLPLADLTSGNYANILDPEVYYALSKPINSPRHRIRDNLPGTSRFCALARRSPELEGARSLAEGASAAVRNQPANVMRRASAYMEMADSRSSFEIEKERPAANRLQRWGRLIGQAGRIQISVDNLDKLQAEVLADDRFTHRGLRINGVFLGHRDRWNEPVPEFIGARPQDLRDLMDGLVEYDAKISVDADYNPIAHAAGLSFGFVYIHPYEDGNGRLHRYLMAHVLAARKVSPAGVVLPVSQAILERSEDYDAVLRGHSAPLMPFIPWKNTPEGNVEVTSDTADLYRFPDVTKEAEFLEECIRMTVEKTLPQEISWIKSHDKALAGCAAAVEMPTAKTESLVAFILQNGGTLSNKRRKHEFAALTDDEVMRVEEIVRDAFDLSDQMEMSPPVP